MQTIVLNLGGEYYSVEYIYNDITIEIYSVYTMGGMDVEFNLDEGFKEEIIDKILSYGK